MGLVSYLFIILPQIGFTFVIIDPITGRETAVEENINPNQDGSEEYLSQNIAISPGHFVRGRTSSINLSYSSNNNDNG